MPDTSNSTTATEDATSAATPQHEDHLDHAKHVIKDAVDKVVDKLPGRDHSDD